MADKSSINFGIYLETRVLHTAWHTCVWALRIWSVAKRKERNWLEFMCAPQSVRYIAVIPFYVHDQSGLAIISDMCKTSERWTALTISASTNKFCDSHSKHYGNLMWKIEQERIEIFSWCQFTKNHVFMKPKEVPRLAFVTKQEKYYINSSAWNWFFPLIFLSYLLPSLRPRPPPSLCWYISSKPLW